MTTADDLRAEAQDQRERAEESFRRCDTDGFLSQWALGLGAQLADRKADIAEHDGKARFRGLYQGDRRVAAKDMMGQYGMVWLLRDDEAARFGRRFVPCGARSRVQRALGLTERHEMAPAAAKMDGRGTGLSGTAWVTTYRTGDKWGLDATACE